MSQDLPELPANVVEAISTYGQRCSGEAWDTFTEITAQESRVEAARLALESSLREWAAQLQRETPEEEVEEGWHAWTLSRRVDAEIRKRIEALPKALGLSTPDCVIVWVSRKAVMRQDLIEALCPAPKEER